MCSNCAKEGVGRRGLLKFGAAGIVALGLSRASGQARAALKSGNERYVSHPELCSIDLAEQRRAVAAHQAPWATIISCADSRVPPELIFGGHGVGELFVARNAGNLVDTANSRHRRVRGGRAWLTAHRGARPHELRRSKGGLRRGHEERDLSRRDRPDD